VAEGVNMPPTAKDIIITGSALKGSTLTATYTYYDAENDPEANIIFGAVIDDNMKDELMITVIATGFENGPVLKKVEKPVADKKVTGSESSYSRTSNERTSTPVSTSSNTSGNAISPENELDIPTFLRRNKFK
jgi:cell division protein FtsZ